MPHDVVQRADEPGIDTRLPRQVLRTQAAAERRQQPPQPFIVGVQGQALGVELAVLGPAGVLPQHGVPRDFEAADGLLEGRLEGAVDGHDFAGGLHLCAGDAVAGGELVERPAGNLHHAVVERGLERRQRLARHRVGYLVEALADGDLGGHTGDGIARRLARQSRAAAHPGVDLDNVVTAGVRRPAGKGLADHVPRGEGKLHVATALDAQRADDLEAGRAQHLVVLVGQGLARRHDDAVAGVDPHRVQVLHVADRDAVVRAVPHHLVLDFLPAHQRLFHQDLGDGAGVEAAPYDDVELLWRLGDAAAGAPEGVGGADHQRQSELLGGAARLVEGADDRGRRRGLANGREQRPEPLPVLGVLDGLQRRAEEPHVVLLENAGVGKLDREVEPRLPAQGGQDAVGPLALDDPLDDFDRQRLDVDGVGDVLVRHDRRRIRVDEDGRDALLAEGAAGLGSGVVELGGLTDNDGARSDNEDLARLAWRGSCGGHSAIRGAMIGLRAAGYATTARGSSAT